MVKLGVDFRRLRYFIAVCDHGGVSKAAGAIGIAQPALTRQIKLLENEVGVPLVERSGRGTIPTEHGRYLLARSREHLDVLDEIVTKTRDIFLDSKAQFTLGVCPTIAPLFLDDLEAFIADNYPNVTLSVIQAYSGDLEILLTGGRLDVALTYRPAERNEWQSMDLLSERLVLVTGPDFKGGTGKRTLNSLVDLRLILPSKIHQLRRIIDRVCGERGIQLAPELELDSLNAVKAMLPDRAFHFATILPFHSVQAEIREGRLAGFPIDDPDMVRTVAVVWGASSPRPALETDVVNRVREQASLLKERLEYLN